MSTNEDKNRPVEQEAVHTTIVGGRPPGSGRGIGNIPRGIEVLVKKASVDAEFRALLIEKRSKAAEAIELKLESAEAAMLDVVPRAQLEAIIDRTTVHPSQVPAFMGYAAGVMLVALGVTTITGCPMGIQPDRPPVKKDAAVAPANPGAATTANPAVVPDNTPKTRGVQPDRPPAVQGVRPDTPPLTKGMSADRPPAKTDGAAPEVKPMTGVAPGGARPDLPPTK